MATESQLLSGQQQALYEALIGKEPQLGSMYLGALWVLRHQENPDRLPHAGHSLRELMEKLPRYLNVPAETQPKMLEKIRGLNKKWATVARKSKCNNNGKWNGTIDGVLKNFLVEFGAFFAWCDQHVPTRKQSTARLLRAFGLSHSVLPNPIENLRIEEWDSIQRFFISVSHHQHSPDDKEFSEWLWALETFLLTQLIPRTFEDQDRIDAIIKEGEGE